MVIREFGSHNSLYENRGVAKHTSYNGLDLSIEIPKGSYRRGTNSQGVEWSQKITCHYGYIKLTGAPDGDHLDCFLRPKPNKNATIYVVHQLTPDGSEYDEDKVMLGFGSKSEATRAWREHAYKPNKMMGTVSEWDPEHFKAVVHACRNSNVIMARESALEKLQKKGVDLKGAKHPNKVLKRLSESIGDTPEQAEQVIYSQLRSASQPGSLQGLDGGWLSWSVEELGEVGQLALARLRKKDLIELNTKTVSDVGVPVPQPNWPGAQTVVSAKLKDDDMSKNDKLYGNLKEMRYTLEDFSKSLEQAGYRKTGGGAQGGEVTYWKGDSAIAVRMHPFGGAMGWKAYKHGEQIASGTDPESLQEMLSARRLRETRLLEDTITGFRKGLRKLNEQKDSEYTTQLMESFSSELHKYSEYETEYRKAELEAMPTWQLAQHMGTLNEQADLGTSRVELIDQILLTEGHKK